MKRQLKLALAIAVTVFLASCGSKNSSEVKLFPVKSGDQYQYIDREGKIIITPQFSEATVFRCGVALVRSTGDKPQWGYIAEDGKYAIPASFVSATIFSEDLAWVVSEGSAPKAINTKGDVKFTLQQAQTVKIFKEGLAAFSVVDSLGQKWGFVDKDGKVKITPQFSEVANFGNGSCAVRNQDGKWGYIDKEGKFVINYQFDRASEFINGKAVVYMAEKAGVIDGKGKFIINPQFSTILIDNDLFLIEQDNKWGWCDKEGKIIINPQFKEALPFLNNDLAPVSSDKTWGYIDKEGKIIINPQFDGALPFNGKLGLVMSSKKIGFIDKEGKFVINPQFDDISSDYVSYIINGSSRYESVETNLLPPAGDVAEKYLIAVGKQKFDEAKTLVTDESKATIDFMAQMVAMGGDGAKKDAATAKVEIKNMKCEEKGDIADCTCSVNDGKKEEVQKLHLVKKDGKWLVEQKKEGGAPSTEPELNEGPQGGN